MTTTTQHATGVPAGSLPRHRLLANAMQLSAENVDRDDIAAYLVRNGLSSHQADVALSAIEAQLGCKRSSFRRSRRRDFSIASVQVVVALIMVGMGVLDGGIFSMIVGAALAVSAYRRLGVANDRTFGDVVLPNRLAHFAPTSLALT